MRHAVIRSQATLALVRLQPKFSTSSATDTQWRGLCRGPLPFCDGINAAKMFRKSAYTDSAHKHLSRFIKQSEILQSAILTRLATNAASTKQRRRYKS